MNELELKLFKCACYWYARYERSNPDVGMGPSPDTIVKRMAEENGIQPPAIDAEFRAKLSRILY